RVVEMAHNVPHHRHLFTGLELSADERRDQSIPKVGNRLPLKVCHSSSPLCLFIREYLMRTKCRAECKCCGIGAGERPERCVSYPLGGERGSLQSLSETEGCLLQEVTTRDPRMQE